MPPKAATPAPEIEAPKAPRIWEFTTKYSVARPTIKSAAERAGAHVWASKFDADLEAALLNKEPYFYIPTDYFVTRAEGDTPEKLEKAQKNATAYAYQSGKVRDVFARWKKKDPTGPRSKLDIWTIKRSGKEGIEGEDEPGIGVWMTLKTETPPAA